MFKQLAAFVLIFVASCHSLPSPKEGGLSLSVVHINDFHSRYEPTNPVGNPCTGSDDCIGGYSRVSKQVKTLLNEGRNSLLLNAGDNFQGTFYYTVGTWNITSEFLNKLPFDAAVLGSHEFDNGFVGLNKFLDALNFPVVVCNVDDSEEPEIHGHYKKSTVVERDGKKIGIIGVIYSTVNESGSTGNLLFSEESASVNEEAERLVNEEGVFTNIVLSHSGYDVDQLIAANATQSISLIVGGHSHVFLYTGDNYPGPEKPQGPYPTVVTSQVSGKQILITQAGSFARYVGNLSVVYDDSGDIVEYSGNPHYLDETYPGDEEIDEALKPWTDLVEEVGNKVVGSTLVDLEGADYVCRVRECTLGNFVADAMVYEYYQDSGDSSGGIAVTYATGVRAGIPAGDITYNSLVTAQPFENTIDRVELTGQVIKEMLEFSASPCWETWNPKYYLELLQVSGIQIVFNITRDQGDRIDSVKVRCQDCDEPAYEDLDLEATYKVILPSYLRTGGDGFTMLIDNSKNVEVGRLDTEVYVDYLAAKSPISTGLEDRITIYGQEQDPFATVEQLRWSLSHFGSYQKPST